MLQSPPSPNKHLTGNTLISNELAVASILYNAERWWKKTGRIKARFNSSPPRCDKTNRLCTR